MQGVVEGKVLVEGNQAAALGALMGGVTVVAWYPFTPSSSLCEYLVAYADRFRVDTATGEKLISVVQAEDELAAVGMAIGAGWAGARAMTSTSGPGISLMAEFSGLAYYAEVPVVIFDIPRIGPSTVAGIARCRGPTIRRPATLPAARATMRWPVTRKAPMRTLGTWTGSRASWKPPGMSCPPRWRTRLARRLH